MKHEGKALYSKAYGSLIGVATGDAMGMPSELWTRQKILNHFGKIETFLSAPDENTIRRGQKAGEVTDDTQVTLVICEAIIEQQGSILPEKIVEKMVHWADKDSAKYSNIIGPSTKKAFELLKQGVPIEETGKFGVTNGGAMRICPVGIISDWRDMDTLVHNVEMACLATHNTDIAIAGASAIAAAVSYGIDGDGNLQGMIEIAKSACEKGMARGHETIGASIIKRIDMGIDIVKNGKSEEGILQDIYDIIGTGLPTIESVPAALSLVYMAQGDPVKCALLSANIGGDTDTIGAMSCGICGAFMGIEAFPDDYIKLICRINNIDFAEVAERLLKYRKVSCSNQDERKLETYESSTKHAER